MKKSKSEFKGLNVTLSLFSSVNKLLCEAVKRSGRSKRQEAAIRLEDFLTNEDEVIFDRPPMAFETSHVGILLKEDINIVLDSLLKDYREKYRRNLTKSELAVSCLYTHLKKYQSISEVGIKTPVKC